MTQPLITLTTHESGVRGLDSFLASCRNHRVDPVRLGLGLPFTGMMQKPKLLHAYLLAHPEIERFVWVDAYDSVLQAGLDEFWACYDTFNKAVVFSTEYAVWPYESLRDLLPPSPTRYRGLCAGAWASTRDAAIWMLQDSGMLELPDDHSQTDQHPAQLWAIRTPKLCGIDHHMQLFGSLAHAEGDFIYRPGVVMNRLTRSIPFAIHANGQSDLRPAAASLGV